MADIPNQKTPTRRWFTGIVKWKYIHQAYYAAFPDGTPKFPEFRAEVDSLKGIIKDWQKVLLAAKAIQLLDIPNTVPQRREDHPVP